MTCKHCKAKDRILRQFTDPENWKEIEEASYSHGAMWQAWNNRQSPKALAEEGLSK